MKLCRGDLNDLVVFDKYQKLLFSRMDEAQREPGPMPAEAHPPEKFLPQHERNSQAIDIRGSRTENNLHQHESPGADDAGIDSDRVAAREILHRESDGFVYMTKEDFARAEETFTGKRTDPSAVWEDGAAPNFEGLGLDVVESGAGHIDPEILDEAVSNNRQVGIDLLALGKPYGDIFRPGHWMYDQISDNYASIRGMPLGLLNRRCREARGL